MDEKKYIEMLVTAGKDKKDAATFVKTVIAAINEKMPSAAEETKDAVMLLKLDDILHGSSGDPFVGICIGMDKMEDSFRFEKKACEDAFNADSNQSIMKGLVKMGEDGKPIWLDSREFLDKEKTKKNNNFGKPLGTRMQRQIAFIIDGQIVRAFGKENPVIGKAYDLKATVTASGFYTLAKESLKELAQQPTEVDLWDMLYSAAGSSSYVTALCDVEQAAKNAFIVTKGFVKHIAETQNGGAMIVLIDGDCEKGVTGFSASDECKGVILHDITVGQEVIICGRVAKMKDGRTNVVTFGVIANPASSAITSGLDALSDISI